MWFRHTFSFLVSVFSAVMLDYFSFDPHIKKPSILLYEEFHVGSNKSFRDEIPIPAGVQYQFLFWYVVRAGQMVQL